jgi:hypothetical protein
MLNPETFPSFRKDIYICYSNNQYLITKLIYSLVHAFSVFWMTLLRHALTSYFMKRTHALLRNHTDIIIQIISIFPHIYFYVLNVIFWFGIFIYAWPTLISIAL